MRRIAWACLLLAATVATVCAQQTVAPAQTAPSGTRTKPISSDKPIYLSGTDQIEDCPAKYNFLPQDGIYRVGGSVSPPKITDSVLAGFGLDEQAEKAVKHYRFEPAKKNGVPVAVMIAIEVKFY
jgi:hypothetical protein